MASVTRPRRGTIPPSVVRDGNRISFVDRVNSRAHRQFMWCLHQCLERGYQDLILDFSHSNSAHCEDEAFCFINVQ